MKNKDRNNFLLILENGIRDGSNNFLTWDWNEFRNINSIEELREYANKRLQFAGIGSSRAVYKFHEKFALKIALNAKGLAQNKSESNVCGRHPEIFTRVRYEDKKYKWIISDFAVPISESRFEDLANISFNEFRYTMFVKLNSKNDIVQELEEYNSNSFMKSILQTLLECDYAPKDFGKLNSWGEIESEQRLVIVDYGLTHKIFNDYYDK